MVENRTVPSGRGAIAFLPYCVRRGDHWSPANLPQQRIFRDSFLARQTGTGEQCSPLQEFFDTLQYFYIYSIPHPGLKRKAAIFTGGLQKAVQNAKKYVFSVAKICKSCFFKQGAQVWCAIFLHIDGLHQRCAKVGVARCKKLQYAENTERVLNRKARKI